MSKARTVANMSITPAAVSDQANTSTGAFDVPSGTTAQRPASPSIGYVRYNTDVSGLENYTATGWALVSIPIPTITSLSGLILAGAATTLTASGGKFGTTQGVVTFISGATTATVNVTPSSDSAFSVVVPSTIYALSSGSTVNVKFTNADGGVSAQYSITVTPLPSGGTVTTSGSYRIHTFTTSSNNFVVPTGLSLTAEVLIVGGGGGGGRHSGGGGGGGGLLYYGAETPKTPSGSALTIGAGTHTVVVGAGAAACTGDYGASSIVGQNSTGQGAGGFNGNNSSVAISGGSTYTAIGGGGGGFYNGQGYGGGSGGGSSRGNGAGGSGTSGQGSAGGAGTYGNVTPYPGAGGGGAGGTGAGNADGNGGAGGAGLAYSISGSSLYYAGGGGGNRQEASSGGGAGGSGVGGNGATNAGAATPGATNRGGGGGGDQYNIAAGGSGGSGVVVIRYIL
jgi:hypothetical protein